MSDKTPLSEQQRLFARHFASTSNASEAARLSGYSPKSAGRQGHRLAKDSRILRLVAEFKTQDEGLKTVQQAMDESALTRATENIAQFDLRDLFTEDGGMVDPKTMPAELAKAIQSFKVSQVAGGAVKLVDVRMCDRLAAIKLLGQQLGMFKDESVVTHKFEDMTYEELQAERAKLAQVNGEIASKAALHGVTLDPPKSLN